MRPLIGIVSRVEYPGDTDKLVVNDEYRRAIIECGGSAFLILPTQVVNYGITKNSEIPELNLEDEQMLVRQLEMCDGILMPGGFKMLNSDFFILDYAIKNDIPILGICLGMQIMANYKKEIWNERNASNGINHRVENGELVHFVNVSYDSKLYSIVNKSRFKVNSLHNYHVLSSKYYEEVGYSEDGLIEAIEYPFNSFNIGVQWHPEKDLTNEVSRSLITSFVESAVEYSRKKNNMVVQ